MARPAALLLQHIRKLAAAQATERSTDREMLERFAREHDETAFTTLLRRHGPMVLRVCQRLLPQSADVEDVFQATFLLLVRKATELRRQESVGNWLYGVAYRLALKARRTAMRRRAYESRARTHSPADPLAEITLREAQTMFDEALNQLPEKCRAPLVLCYLEGLTQEEAARQLGCSLSTLKRCLESGRERLRKRLACRRLTLTGALLAAVLSPRVADGGLGGELTRTTVKAGLAYTGKNAITGIVSARVAALVEGGLKSMFTSKQIVLALVALGIVAGSAGVILSQRTTSSSPDESRVQQPEQAAKRPNPPVAALRKHPPTDRFGDPLPEGVLARLGSERFRHGVVISALNFSPDGKIVASGTHTGTIRLWDAASGKALHLLTGHGGGVYSLAFSVDSKTLASASWDQTIRTWDVPTGDELRVINAQQNVVWSLAFSSDAKKLASGGFDHSVRIWDPATGKELQQMLGHQDWVKAVAFSKDGETLISGSYDKTVRIWEVSTGKEISNLKGHDGKIETVAFCPDSKTVASGGQDETIRLWDVTTGQEIRQLQGHTGTVSCVAFSPDGKTLASTGNQDHSIRRWETSTGKELPPNGHQRRAQCLAYSPDGKMIASGGWDCVIRFWDTTTGKELQRTPGHGDGIWKVAFSPDGKTIATASRDKTVRLWDRTTGKEIRLLEGHLEIARCVAFSPNGKLLASGGNDMTIRLWDVANGKEIRRFDGANRIKAVAFSADGKLLASASGEDWIGQEEQAEQPLGPGEVRLWDVANGKQILRWQGFQGGVKSVAFSPDGKWLAAAGNDSTVRFREMASGREVHQSPRHQGTIESIAFSPDGKILASGGMDGVINIWKVANTEHIRAFKGPAGPIMGLAFSPDGKTLAIGSWPFSGRSSIDDPPDTGNPVRLLEVATGKDRGGFKDPLDRCNDVAFSPDGLVLASAGQDSIALLWDVTGRSQDGRLKSANLGLDDLRTLWSDLSGDDAVKAYRAIWTLAADPKEVISFVEKHLQTAPQPADAERINKLIASLDDNAFAIREKATFELEMIGERVEPALRKGLEDAASEEARQRLKTLLDKFDQGISFEQLRTRRVIEVLEHAGVEEAKQLLHKLAQTEPEARAALERLKKTKIEKP